MKVTDSMVEAALKASQVCITSATRHWMRAALEAGIAAWVKPTRAEAARARWNATSTADRRKLTSSATQKRIEDAKLRKIDNAPAKI